MLTGFASIEWKAPYQEATAEKLKSTNKESKRQVTEHIEGT